MIKGDKASLKADPAGFISIKIKKKLRKTDFSKLRDKEVPVKREAVLKLEAKTNELRTNASNARNLQQVIESKEDLKMKYIDSECDLSADSLLKDCKYEWDLF